MSDERFRELVNLYLDKEISSSEMESLQSEIGRCEARRKDFDIACRLHHAMSCALSSEVAANEARSPLPRTRWLVGMGMAASFALGGILLAPAISEELIPTQESQQTEASAEALAAAAQQRVLERFLAAQHTAGADEPCRSLAARFRLLGLQPALVPADHTLEEVEMRIRRVQVQWNEQEQSWQFITVSGAMPTERTGDLNALFYDSPFQLEVANPGFVFTTGEPIAYPLR
ncbi:MAG: hypothetical protein ACPGKS_06650 [Coraliomargarita sp.]